MAISDSISATFERLGSVERTFRCCDTEFLVTVDGFRAPDRAARARQVAESLESQLNAFDGDSAVAHLNRRGHVENEHVARLVRRGVEYLDRTAGAFDIRYGRLEHDLKDYLRGKTSALPETFDAGSVSVDGDVVRVQGRLDLNGLAKGYIVDRAAAELTGPLRRGFVSGGGDLSPPTGPVAIESPYGDSSPLEILDTDWAIATSGGYRRTRDGTDHIYDPIDERLGSRHESVTVVARRDCTEADALATTLAILPVRDALALVSEWPGLEALLVHDGVFHRSSGFQDHVHHETTAH